MEEKFGERKAEKIGSEAKESRGDWAVDVAVGDLKVERRCRGEDEDCGVEDDESGDLWSGIACEAIFVFADSLSGFVLVLVSSYTLEKKIAEIDSTSFYNLNLIKEFLY